MPMYITMSRESRMAFNESTAPSPPIIIPDMDKLPEALFTWSLISAPFSIGFDVTELV